MRRRIDRPLAVHVVWRVEVRLRRRVEVHLWTSCGSVTFRSASPSDRTSLKAINVHTRNVDNMGVCVLRVSTHTLASTGSLCDAHVRVCVCECAPAWKTPSVAGHGERLFNTGVCSRLGSNVKSRENGAGLQC